MAQLNAGQKFSEKKKLTVPVVKIPKKVKDALNIVSASESGIFKIEPLTGMAMYDCCYIIEDVNYITQDDADKESILLQVMTWLKSMNQQFKITIANEHIVLKDYMDEVFQPIEDAPRKLSEGIRQWIREKMTQGVKDVNKILYLTVTCRAKNFEEAALHFASLDTSLNRIFSLLKSRLYRLSGRERLDVLCRMLNPENPFKMKDPTPADDGWKNSVLPSSIESFPDHMLLGSNNYVSVLFGHDYDQTLNDEKVLHALTELSYPMAVTLDIEPVDKMTLKNKLASAMTNNDRAIAQERNRNNRLGQYGISYRLDKKKEEIEELLDQVDDNDEQSVFLGLLVAVTAHDLTELNKRVDSLKEAAKANGYFLDTYNHRQLKALNTALPFGGRQVNHMRSFLSSAAVAFNPFYARDLKDPGGYIYGLNRTTKHLIRGNRKLLKNPHGFIAGHSGGGKSFLVKETEVVQTLLLTHDDVILVDPQNEFENTVLEQGGQYFDLTPQSKIYLNPFDVPEEIQRGDTLARNKYIAQKTEYACAFVEAAMHNIVMTQVHKTFIVRAVQEMYADYFARRSRKINAPGFGVLWEKLKSQRDEADNQNDIVLLSDMIHSLEPYVIGVYDMFSKPSNLDIHSRLVGFGLKNVPQSIWEPVMVTMMQFLAERVSYNQEDMVATHLIVDEAQVLCERPSSASQLLYAIETYRKYGGIVTLIVQNLVRALETPDLRDMFSNCAFKVFLDQGGVDARSLSQIQELSQSEYRCLEENIPGYGVMVWDKQVILFDASMSKKNPLYEGFSTNFHEHARNRAALEDARMDDLAAILYLHPQSVDAARELLQLSMEDMDRLVRYGTSKRVITMTDDGVLSLQAGDSHED